MNGPVFQDTLLNYVCTKLHVNIQVYCVAWAAKYHLRWNMQCFYYFRFSKVEKKGRIYMSMQEAGLSYCTVSEMQGISIASSHIL